MDAIADAAERAFPGRTIAEITPQNTRQGNAVGRVTFASGGEVYVKTATDTTHRLEREVAATRYAAANCAVEVPEVLGASTEGSPAYLALAPLPGTPLNDPWREGDERAPLVREAGRTLGTVHETQFDTPGRIVGGDAECLELTDETWTETMCETILWRAEDWFADRFVDIPERLVEILREARPVLDGAESSLLHADCSRINVHLDPNGLLDWERALVGDPAFDLVDARGHLIDQIDVEDSEKEGLTTAFYEGYRDARGSLPAGLDEREPIYWPIAHLLVPQTFEEWAPPLDRPTEELAEQVRAEFNSRLEEARRVID